MMKFFAAPVYSEAGGMASVSVFRGDEGIYVGEMQMSREEAVEFVECLRLGSGLSLIFERAGV